MGRVLAGILIAAAMARAGSAARGQSSHDPEPSAGPAKASDIFATLRAKWAQDLYEKRIEASVAAYAPDAEFIGPDGSRVIGTTALRQLFAGITATFDSNLTFYSWRVEISGDLAFDSGTYRETLVFRASGERQHSSGSYLSTYRRGKDGSWLIAEQVWTGSISKDSATAPGLDPNPVVALTFDDLPAAGSLPPGENRFKIASALTAELKANRLEGTYGFVNAVKLENDPDARQALHIWVDAGMNVGSHTWSHISLSDNTAAAFENEIAKNEPALAQYGGTRDWHWFRYPFLWEGDTLDKRREVRAFLHDHGYRVAQVSMDFEDYAWNDAYGRCVGKKDDAAISWLKQSYLETASEYIKLGREEQQIAFGHEIPNVMLLHATAFTTVMLPDLLDLLRKQGFRFASLPQVEQDPAYAQDPDAALKYGGTLPDQFMDSRHLTYPPFQPKPFEKIKTLCQ
jgi:peptidoglycan/xylan/chitin deacetylase (PgdA/CDA1 family)